MTDMRDWDSRDRHIAAAALRQAARTVIEDARKEKEGSPPREDWATADGAEITGDWLDRMADELERG